MDLDQCLEEGFEDYSVEYDILSVRLDHSQLWLTIPVLQIVSEYLLQLGQFLTKILILLTNPMADKQFEIVKVNLN